MSTKVPHKAKAFLPDKIMPHFGRVFGLTEDAAALLLERMELVSINSATNLTRVLPKGWEQLGAEFGVECLVEAQKSRVCDKDVWYVRLGRVSADCLYPVKIWSKYKKSASSVVLPLAIGNRRSTAFVTKELVSILKDSHLFDKLVQTRYFGSTDCTIDLSKIGRTITSGRSQRVVRSCKEPWPGTVC